MKKHLTKIKFFLAILLTISLLIGFSVSANQSIQDTGGLVFTNEIPEENKVFNKYIYLSGEVKNPGTYKFNEELRLSELIEKAGGFTENADLEFINKDMNLAEKIKDEQKIFIPSKIATTNTGNSNDSSKTNLNTATLDQLDKLPGIGPSTAQKIIDARPFKSIEDLKNVSGIGDAKFDDVKDLIGI